MECIIKKHRLTKLPLLAVFRLFPVFILALGFFMGSISAQQENPPASAGPYSAGRGEIKAPAPLFQPMPPYTEEARKEGLEGIVILQALIRKDGTVGSLTVLKGLGYGLDESAIHTISTAWRFQPGTRKGEAIDMLANISISFGPYGPITEAEKARLKEYSLQVLIAKAQLIRNPYGVAGVSGYGSLRENGLFREFKYTCSCAPLNPRPGNRTYPAKWKNPESRLEILVGEIGNITKQKICELKVEITNSYMP